MKMTLTTTFAIALMVFAFSTNPVMAFGGDGIWASKPQVDEVKDPDETGNERGVADSGNEGSTSAASEGGISAIRVTDDTSDKIGRDNTGSTGTITSGQ